MTIQDNWTKPTDISGLVSPEQVQRYLWAVALFFEIMTAKGEYESNLQPRFLFVTNEDYF